MLCSDPIVRRAVGGPSRNRTGVQGFAVLCVTTPPSGLEYGMLVRCGVAGRLASDSRLCNRDFS